MIQKATFGAGCFWHVEEAFRKIGGVVKTTVGYMGGDLKDPSYEQVCSDETGHAEVCQVEFDPEKVSYESLLETFWKIHDPTQLDRQGFDMGRQYRSVIFYHNISQKAAALNSREDAQRRYSRQIETEIFPATEFYPAEEYHQKYLMKSGKKTC